MVKKLVPENILRIAPYQPGKPIEEVARELGIADPGAISKLASNENPLGPSPLALEAIRKKLPRINLYPDGNGHYLKKALAEKLGVESGHLVLGNGSNEIIELITHVFAVPGKQMVFSGLSFVVYRLMAQIFGVESVEVPMRDFTVDLDALSRVVDSRTSVLALTNPNNPTGTAVSPSALDAFLRGLPRDIVVVLDEAYYEYLPEPLRFDGISCIDRPGYPHLVLLRTFSKAYGLAGLRIGYGIASPEVINVLNRVRQPFNTNTLAQVGALAALGDDEHVARTIELAHSGLRELERGFLKLGLEYVPSVANFILVRVGDGAEVFERLLRRGIIVRPMVGYGLPEYIRVTVGLPEENRKLLVQLPEVI